MKTIEKRLSRWFFLLLISSFALIFYTGRTILSIRFLGLSGEYLADDPLNEAAVFEQLQRWIYFSQAIYLIIKILLVAITIYVALIFANVKCRFLDIALVVVQCEYIFLLAGLIKLIAFSALYHPGTLSDWNRFHPLSALSILSDADQNWYYPLQVLNVFEFTYWFALAFGLSKLTGEYFDRSLRIIVTSYVPALGLWTLILTTYTMFMFPSHT